MSSREARRSREVSRRAGFPARRDRPPAIAAAPEASVVVADRAPPAVVVDMPVAAGTPVVEADTIVRSRL